MNLDHTLLRTFVAAVDTLSFTKAASIVHKSPATVSMQIAKLEERLECDLFRRNTRNVILTNAGEELLSYARRMLRLHDEAVEAIRRPDVSGSVTIAAPDDYISSILPPVLRRFGAIFPKVELTVICAQTTALIPQLEAGNVDLAIITETMGIKGQIIRREPMVWISSPERQALTRSPLPVALFEPGSRARDVVIAALNDADITYRAAYSSLSQLGMLSIVEADLAIAAVVQSAAPKGFSRLGAADGLPEIQALDVVLTRGLRGNTPPCDALADAILGTASATALM